MRSNNKRNDILEAALQVVADEGANHLTIDAVAACAGFSKGGVLYHFGSKKALLSGMLDYLMEANSERMSRHLEPGNTLAALLHVENQMTAAERRASLALVAAAAEDPELLEPARRYVADIVNETTDESSDPLFALTLFLAHEGLRFLDIFELNPLDKKQSANISGYLANRAEELSK